MVNPYFPSWLRDLVEALEERVPYAGHLLLVLWP